MNEDIELLRVHFECQGKVAHTTVFFHVTMDFQTEMYSRLFDDSLSHEIQRADVHGQKKNFHPKRAH